jgi:hypothetical protein
MHEVRNAYKILASKIEKKRPLRRPRYQWIKRVKWILKKYYLKM